TRASGGFFDRLRNFRFSGDVFAVPEGTVLFAGEPIMMVRAPLMESQIPETYLLSTLTFQTLIATKASRIVRSAGGRGVVEFGPPLWGIRLDSGDFVALSKQARAILDAAGLREAKIMASGDLDEWRIADLLAAGAPIDAFGVGTELATSGDAPSMGAIYKLVEV